MKNSGPRIGFWDIETSPLIVATFGLFDQNIPYTSIIQDWFIICAAWKRLDEKKIRGCKITDNKSRFKKDHTDDYHVVKALYDFVSSVDILIAHNGDNFDWKKFMARVIKHGLPPIKKPILIDTLKVSRESKFTSNKLGNLAKHFGFPDKLPSGMDMWVKATQGDKPAIEKMAKYNKGDIPPLEQLYLKLKPYMKNHPNMNVFQDKPGCPRCGGTHIRRKGFEYSKTGKFQKYQCCSCGVWFQGKKVGKVTEFR